MNKAKSLTIIDNNKIYTIVRFLILFKYEKRYTISFYCMFDLWNI